MMNGIGTRAELRAAVTRGFFEQHVAKLGARTPQLPLPRQLAPISRSKVAAVLDPDIDEPETNGARVSALAGLAHAKNPELLGPLLGERIADEAAPPRKNACPCCAARSRSRGAAEGTIDQLENHDTSITFDADALLTTVTTTVAVAANLVDWRILVARCDPQNWKKSAPTYFRMSDPLPATVTSQPPGIGGWKGRLHEYFDWQWNPDSAAMFDNELNIDFSFGEQGSSKFLRCEYSLYRSNASKLWTARESGGLDVDGGVTEAQLDARWLVVKATKQLRFTEPELGPPGLGAMLNYLAPTTTGLWMHHAIQIGVEQALRSAPRAHTSRRVSPPRRGSQPRTIAPETLKRDQ
jgi:hypothetical protein